jgi:hypothetical protein
LRLALRELNGRDAVPGKPAVSFAMHEVRAGRVFAAHQVRAGRAGAREDFEEMIVRLVRAVARPDARRVSADHGGDWGIDVVAGDLNGRAAIWQAKYFMEGVKRPQCKQVEASFAAAVSKAKARGYMIERWVLCIPDSLGPAATQWWERWKAEQSLETGIGIDLWDDTDLIGLLATREAAGVRDEYYGWAWAYAGAHGSSHDSQDEGKFLDAYRNQVQDWYGYLELPNPRRRDRVPVAEIYVPAGIREDSGPRGGRPDGAGAPARLTVADLPGLIRRTVLLGDPGGGKSTVSSVLMDACARDDGGLVPFLVTLREYAPELRKRPVVGHIEDTVERRHHCPPPRGLVERLLRAGLALVIFDGLDEVLDVADRRAAALCIEQLCRAYPGARVLVTSRAEAYDQGRLDGTFTRYRLDAFGSAEAAWYALNWFRWHGERVPGETAAFLSASSGTGELRSNPLLLSLMCTVYRDSGTLPRDRVDLYERCADMLIREWDRQRNIDPGLRTRDLIRPLIHHLALWVLSRPGGNTPAGEDDLAGETERFLRNEGTEPAGEERAAAAEFLQFCRERAWVLSSVTTETGHTGYRFTHQALLDYYAAAGLARASRTPAALSTAIRPRVLAHAWHFSQLAISVMARSTPGAADQVCELLLRQPDLPADRTQVLKFLTMLLGTIQLQPATVRALTRAMLRHRIDRNLEPDTEHPLGLLLYDDSHTELVTEEMTRYIDTMTASPDTAERAEALRILLEVPEITADTHWKQWSADQARRHAAEIAACSAWSSELRTLALHAGLMTLDEALPMPGGLDALLVPAGSLLEPAPHCPYPAWLYMQADGEVAEHEFALIGRRITGHPEPPWTRASSEGFGISDIHHQSVLAEAGASLGELAGLGLAAMHAICCELFPFSAGTSGRPPVDGLPMPPGFEETFRDWAENRLSVTAQSPAGT